LDAVAIWGGVQVASQIVVFNKESRYLTGRCSGIKVRTEQERNKKNEEKIGEWGSLSDVETYLHNRKSAKAPKGRGRVKIPFARKIGRSTEGNNRLKSFRASQDIYGLVEKEGTR